MEHFKPLSVFFEAISKDGRISIAHIGLYAVLLQCWQDQDFENPVMAFSHELMCVAKISHRATFLKCLNDLSERGYIRYECSLKRNVRSRIFLLYNDQVVGQSRSRKARCRQRQINNQNKKGDEK